MTITPLSLFIAISAVWRLSSLFANEAGPFYMFTRLRRYAAHLEKRNRFCAAFHLYEGLECEWCNGVWFGSLAAALWFTLGDGLIYVLLPLAISTWVIAIKYIIQTLEQVREYAERLNK